MKRFWYSVVGLCVAVGLYLVVQPVSSQSLNDELTHQINQMDLDARWMTEMSREQKAFLDTLFATPFRFLGRGKQCEAYLSANARYVVKLVRQKPLSLKPYIADLPDFFPFGQVKKFAVKRRLQRKEALFTSFMLAYKRIPEHTGMLFMHLNPTQGLLGVMHYEDEFGVARSVRLDSALFVVQRKAKLLKPVLEELREKGDIAEAKKRIDWVFELLFDCIKKQVLDLDTGLIRRNNIGLLDDRAIYIDTGKLRAMQSKMGKEDFIKDLKRLKPLHRWLLANYAELAPYFELREKYYIDKF